LNQENPISNHEDVNILLWHRFKAGDADALGQIAQVHYRALYNYGSKFSSDTDFVRDCIQELYLELWERRSYLSETSFIKSYLLKALRHKLIKESKRLRRFQEPRLLTFDAEENTHPVEETIIENENTRSVLKKLNQIVSGLSKRQQEIIYLRFYQNLENDDISHIMGLGKQSVANLLYRTIKEIKGIWIPAEFAWLLLMHLIAR
jgi:RNA polymerase sigma factor (sigma-70 family)